LTNELVPLSGRIIIFPTLSLVRAARKAGAAAEIAATRKEEKYVDLSARYFFEPIAVETFGVFNASARVLLDDLGRRITFSSGEARESSFLYQKVLAPWSTQPSVRLG